MVAEVEDERLLAAEDRLLEPLACLVLGALGVVATAGEVRNAILAADAFDDADQALFLDPDLGADRLIEPPILAILARDRLDNCGRVFPRCDVMDVPGSVLDCVPVDQPRPARCGDDMAEPLVFALLVLDQPSRDELIKKLAQGQGKTARLIFDDDRVRLLD